MPEEEAAARRVLEDARAIAGLVRGSRPGRVVRARRPGEAIVAEVDALQADLVVLRATPGRRSALFGETVNYVLKHASCRVLVHAPSSRR